jgi:hypothetical protein
MIGLLNIITGLMVIILSVLYFRKVLADKDRKRTIVLLFLSIFFYAPILLALIYFFVMIFTVAGVK